MAKMQVPNPPPRAVIFDLGDVLFSWSAKTDTTIPSLKLREVLSSDTWHSYERGEISRDACFEKSAEIISYPASEIALAFTQARESLQPDLAIISLLQDLKKSNIRLYAMSNIGKEDYEDIEDKIDWSIFDRIFTSAAAGMRKPEMGFYRYVLTSIGLAGSEVVFTDDKEENINAAKTLGIHGLVFQETTVHTLRKLFDNPVAKAWGYLFQNAKHCDSVTSSGIAFTDNFAKLLVADTLSKRDIIDMEWGSKETWNFFEGEPALVPGGFFPDDLDTTCLALQALEPPAGIITPLLDTMATYVNDDGTFQTYFQRERHRVDPIVSANILACFYHYGRGREFDRTLKLVHSTLESRAYMDGTRYYPSPDCCLGFIGRLLRVSNNDEHLQTTLGPLLKSRIGERVGMSGSPMELAMRIITCKQMGIPCEGDCAELLSSQCDDGSWEAGWMYRYGSTGETIGNRAVTTAMAVAALSH